MDALSSSFMSTLPPQIQRLHYSPTKTKAPLLLPSSSSSSRTNNVIVSTTSPPKKPETTEENNKQQTKTTQKPSSSVSTTTNVSAVILNTLNKLIKPKLQAQPLSLDPSRAFSNNLAPVDELHPTQCQVTQGSLPSCLEGAYIRNGPNPQYPPRSEPYSPFDGDGMLHCIKISQGQATFCSRYVKTYKYTIENTVGSPIVPSPFSSFSGPLAFLTRAGVLAARVLTGQLSINSGFGLANTSLAFLGNRLLALYEGDLPYAVRLTSNGDIETLGRCDLDGKLVMNMTAHPKKDPETGEMFAFRYSPMPPFVTYFWFDANGEKQPDVHIKMPGQWLRHPPLMHDFAITKRYAIFVDTQVQAYGMEMILRREPLLHSDPTKVSRIGVMPRYAKNSSQMRWFDAPGLNNIHAVNAWDEEDGNVIVMVAPNILSVEQVFERMELIHCLMEKVRIDLRTGVVSRHPISARNLDMAVINPGYVAKKNRYVYAAVGDPMPKMTGLVKLDLTKGERQECTVATRIYGPDCYGGEPFFAARDAADKEADEDDGYILSYVHDEKAGESKFLVMDAKSPHLDIVAEVKLPQRVPAGFHGLFVREIDFCKL
ncbi:hypothetical protein CISIN_1g044992mg [Citrus sinensis]|uniref:Carotenoid cleavage dioxygenase 4 n=1 Tax=Citrus sinensis TaxID=2711 RepID=A0A067FY61_CITSI|nr:hypothetical protein CISIN_1g044992mg [Citrus sinensis]